MSTKQLIGEPITAYDGTPYTVTVETWANEAPECVTVDGYACLVMLGPGTRSGRAAITGLIGNLQGALAVHDQAVEEIYAGLKVGDDAGRIRVAHEGEAQCTHPLGGTQCHRVEHVDGHHVAVDGDFDVIAVAHA